MLLLRSALYSEHTPTDNPRPKLGRRKFRGTVGPGGSVPWRQAIPSGKWRVGIDSTPSGGDPKNVGAYKDRGDAYSKKTEAHRAAADYAEASRLRKEQAPVHVPRKEAPQISGTADFWDDRLIVRLLHGPHVDGGDDPSHRGKAGLPVAAVLCTQAKVISARRTDTPRANWLLALRAPVGLTSD
jgi:hypothetical protein